MQCVTPMFRIYYPEDKEATGYVISRQKAAELIVDNNNYIRNFSDKVAKLQKIPCRKCWACQLNYSAEWATRIMHECQKDDYNWFITLTYDNDHLPIAEKIEVGENIYENDGTWTGTLHEPDMIRFLNSLRKHFERKGVEGIKYFYCGEYGETTHRPHYHIILMHCPLDIQFFYDTHVDSNFKAHWKSTELEQYWKEGMIDIAECEWSSAAYVARYCTKKITYSNNKEDYYKIGKIPEYSRKSKGIGFDYLKQHYKKIYENDEIIMKTVKGNTCAARPPKAYDKKIEQLFPEMMEKLKESRQWAAERAEKIKEGLSNYTDMENLIMAAEKVKTKAQLLPRVGEW